MPAHPTASDSIGGRCRDMMLAVMEMDRYLATDIFGIPGLNIAWYGALVACAFILGILLALLRARRDGLKSETLLDFALILTPVCLVCARIYYVIFQWDELYAAAPVKALYVWEGGLAIYGGVIGGVITALVFCHVRRIPFARFADICVPSLPLGQAVGRWGNYVNQEAYGGVVTNPKWQFFPYAQYIEALGQWRQAAFFYECVLNLAVLTVLLAVTGRSKRRGLALPLYFICYGLGRFFIEGLRADSLYILPGLRVSQLLSAALVLLGAILLVYTLKKKLLVFTSK